MAESIISIISTVVTGITASIKACNEVLDTFAKESDARAQVEADVQEFERLASEVDRRLLSYSSKNDHAAFSCLYEMSEGKESAERLKNCLATAATQIEELNAKLKEKKEEKKAWLGAKVLLRPGSTQKLLKPFVEASSSIRKTNVELKGHIDLFFTLLGRAESEATRKKLLKDFQANDNATSLVTGMWDNAPFNISGQAEDSKGDFTPCVSALLSSATHEHTSHEILKKKATDWVGLRNASSAKQWEETSDTLRGSLRLDPLEERLSKEDTPKALEFISMQLSGALKLLRRRKNDKDKVSIPLFGNVNVGKSTFLNAIMGQFILPTDNAPMTAWPCRIQHVPDQANPKLKICLPFVKKMWTRLFHEYKEIQNEGSSHPKWSASADLEKPTHDVIQSLIDENFTPQEETCGAAPVRTALKNLNHILRACNALFAHQFQPVDPASWLDLSLEFTTFKGVVDFSFEFVDLPGKGEWSETKNPQNDLEHMYKCALGLHQHHLVIADTHELVNNQFGTFIQWLRRNVLQGDTVYPLMVVVTKLDALTEHGHVNVRLKTAQKAIFGNPSKAGYEIDPTIRICSAEHYFGYVYLMEYLELFLSAQAANKKKGKGEMPDFEHLYSPHSPSNAVLSLVGVRSTVEEDWKTFSRERFIGRIKDRVPPTQFPKLVSGFLHYVIEGSRQQERIADDVNLSRRLGQLAATCRGAVGQCRATSITKELQQESQKALDGKLVTWDTQKEAFMKKTREDIQKLLDAAMADAKKRVEESVLKEADLEDSEEHDMHNQTIEQARRFLYGVERKLDEIIDSVQGATVERVRRALQSAWSDRIDEMKSSVDADSSDSTGIREITQRLFESVQGMELTLRSHIVNRLITSLPEQDPARNYALAQTLARQNAERDGAERIGVDRTGNSPDGGARQLVEQPGGSARDEAALQLAADGCNDLGFLLRAPQNIIAMVRFLIGQESPLKNGQSTTIHCDVVIGKYIEHVVKPWHEMLSGDVFKSFEGMAEAITKEGERIRAMVNSAHLLLQTSPELADDKQLLGQLLCASFDSDAAATGLHIIIAKWTEAMKVCVNDEQEYGTRLKHLVSV